MDEQYIRRILATLSHRAGPGADSVQVAAAVLATMRDIEAALTPVLGQRGVAALHARSLHLASAANPWLAPPADGGPVPAALESAFARQSPTTAAEGGAALLLTFCDLLASLIGHSLTERLLRSVWTQLSSGPPAEDISR